MKDEVHTPGENYFPILYASGEGVLLGCQSVPFDFVAPYENQAQKNHSQSLKRLKERGGLGPLELYYVMKELPYDLQGALTQIEALQIILNWLKEWKKEHINKFVVGFCFDSKKNYVLLIKKKRPDWQKGLFNGIGGKIEFDESPQEAMNRESLEEADLSVDWFYRGIMKGTNNDKTKFECSIFSAYDDAVNHFKQMEDEKLYLISVHQLSQIKTIENLYFLIPMLEGNPGMSFAEFIYDYPKKT